MKSPRILFITSNRLGDAVLSTGLLDHLICTHSGADITVACGPLATSLFEKAPGVSILLLEKKKHYGHWLKLWRQCALKKWDIIVDLRNSAVSRLLYARKKHIWKTPDPALHKVEQNAALLGL